MSSLSAGEPLWSFSLCSPTREGWDWFSSADSPSRCQVCGGRAVGVRVCNIFSNPFSFFSSYCRSCCTCADSAASMWPRSPYTSCPARVTAPQSGWPISWEALLPVDHRNRVEMPPNWPRWLAMPVEATATFWKWAQRLMKPDKKIF